VVSSNPTTWPRKANRSVLRLAVTMIPMGLRETLTPTDRRETLTPMGRRGTPTLMDLLDRVAIIIMITTRERVV